MRIDMDVLVVYVFFAWISFLCAWSLHTLIIQTYDYDLKVELAQIERNVHPYTRSGMEAVK